MLELFVSSAILITVVALLRLLFRTRMPPGLQYALWLLVLLRLALPFPLFPSSISAAGAVSRIVQTVQMDDPEQAAPPSQLYAEGSEAAPTTERPGLEQGFLYVWLAGSVITAIWFGSVNLKFAAQLRRGRQRLKSSAPVPVYMAGDLSSPCLYGLLQPAIYLTEQAVNDPQRAEVAVAHELTHWRHRDHLWSFVRILCLIVYWFDPFVWLAAKLSKQDGELFCDAGTIRCLGEERRIEYGRTLLEMTESSARRIDLLCSASTMSGGARRMRERLAAIVSRPVRSLPAIAAVVVVMLAAAACTFAGSSEALDAEPMEITPTSPPLILESPAPDEVVATLPPAAISEADEQIILVPTPVPTQAPADTPAPASTQSTANTSVPIEATNEEDTTDDDTPSGGGGTPPMRWVEAASGGSTPTLTLPPDETEALASETTAPAATPPTDETEPVVVHDMRDVYMNSDSDPYPDMPSTVPDSPPPETIPETSEGE